MPPLLPASAAATRFAAHWVADALAGDEALEFSVLKALVGASSESLAGAPEATRERVALRCLEEVSTVIAAGGDAAATAKALRADGARSCEDLLLQLVGEVGSSGNFEKDLLPPFSQDIQDIICIKKPTLPKTSFELLREVDPEITHMAPPSQLEQNATSQFDNDQSLCSSQDHVNIEKPRLPGDNGELQKEALDTAMISQPHSNETHLSALQHDTGEKPNQDLDDVSAIIKPVEKDHFHEELTQQASVLPSIISNGAIQAGQFETNHQPGDTTEPTMVFEQQIFDKSHLEVSGASKVNQALHDGGIHESHAVNDGLNAQTDPMPQACNITLHDKISEASYLSEGNTRENTTDIQKSASVPSSNPVAPSGRRSKLCWTEEEEAVLKEAMEKFTPQDDAPIPWVQILEYGRDVFHRTRLPPDLRVKWRSMKKKGVC
nr:unnamed protein product [Digitaria exilis]